MYCETGGPPKKKKDPLLPLSVQMSGEYVVNFASSFGDLIEKYENLPALVGCTDKNFGIMLTGRMYQVVTAV